MEKGKYEEKKNKFHVTRTQTFSPKKKIREAILKLKQQLPGDSKW